MFSGIIVPSRVIMRIKSKIKCLARCVVGGKYVTIIVTMWLSWLSSSYFHKLSQWENVIRRLTIDFWNHSPFTKIVLRDSKVSILQPTPIIFCSRFIPTKTFQPAAILKSEEIQEHILSSDQIKSVWNMWPDSRSPFGEEWKRAGCRTKCCQSVGSPTSLRNDVTWKEEWIQSHSLLGENNSNGC